MSSDCSDGNPPPTLFSEVAVLGSETDSVADDAPASGAVVASVTEGISIANTKHRATVANSAEPLSRLRWRRSHGWYLRPFCRVLNFPVPISHSAPPPRAIERNVFGLQERKRRTTRPHGSNTPWDCLRLFSYPTNVPNCQDFIRTCLNKFNFTDTVTKYHYLADDWYVTVRKRYQRFALTRVSLSSGRAQVPRTKNAPLVWSGAPMSRAMFYGYPWSIRQRPSRSNSCCCGMASSHARGF